MPRRVEQLWYNLHQIIVVGGTFWLKCLQLSICKNLIVLYMEGVLYLKGPTFWTVFIVIKHFKLRYAVHIHSVNFPCIPSSRYLHTLKDFCIFSKVSCLISCYGLWLLVLATASFKELFTHGIAVIWKL